jgi:hypothetical protein
MNKVDIYRSKTERLRALGFAVGRRRLRGPGFAFLSARASVVAIERGGAATEVAVIAVSVRGRSIEQRSHSSVRMVMVVAISIVQTGLAHRALNFLAQRIGNERSPAFAAGDTADVRRIDVELHRDALVDPAKNGEQFYRVRDTIELVTVHDFLGQKRRPE